MSELIKLAERLNELEIYRNLLLENRQSSAVVVDILGAATVNNNVRLDFSDCSSQLIDRLIDIVNDRIDAVKGEMSKIMYPVRKDSKG